jgi:hypothetical protein
VNAVGIVRLPDSAVAYWARNVAESVVRFASLELKVPRPRIVWVREARGGEASSGWQTRGIKGGFSSVVGDEIRINVETVDGLDDLKMTCLHEARHVSQHARDPSASRIDAGLEARKAALEEDAEAWARANVGRARTVYDADATTLRSLIR